MGEDDPAVLRTFWTCWRLALRLRRLWGVCAFWSLAVFAASKQSPFEGAMVASRLHFAVASKATFLKWAYSLGTRLSSGPTTLGLDFLGTF